ncbi:adenylate/guanylate cyclase domain-containing protein [Leeia aquatica]|uniref:Adenylate/guanylate cyclase domain-containing protein n=1 Tax=Leeia aquatica TaxID=2725557 RepID=A0A847RYF4_9NEIS|nr:adenylate/guanylate cyclase domain-containing protein [Leeia aquatica]NLR76180.1 adenylate/guanylate cyclase domain-containing protein [Leeia aquatica]
MASHLRPWLTRLQLQPALALAGLFALWVLMEALAGLRLLAPLDTYFSDHLLRQHASQRPTPDNIVMIGIDQRSLEDDAMLDFAGRNWPWPRMVHAELLRELQQRGAKAVIFDLTFTEGDPSAPESDRAFAQALRAFPAYLPLVVQPDGQPSPFKRLPPLMAVRPGPDAQPDAGAPLLTPMALPVDVWRTGLINFLPDPDTVGRRYYIDYSRQGWRIPSLPARVARDQGWVVPLQTDILLNWYSKPFPRLSYRDVVLSRQFSKPIPLPDLRGKIIIVGAYASGLSDLHPTPLSRLTDPPTPTAGPEILATALANLQHGDWLRPAPRASELGLAILLMFLLAWGWRRGWHVSLLALGLLLATALSTLGSYLLLQRTILWLPFSYLTLCWLYFFICALLYFLAERRRREHTVQLFNRFLDPRVVRKLVDRNALAQAEVGQAVEISVLFSDIRGFTTLSERQPPEKVVQMLNGYFDLQVEAIDLHGGTLDKFIGDAIMAFWGAPLSNPHHASEAVAAALDMTDRLEQFKRMLGEAGQGFDIGIGIHSGPAVVGLIGSTQRRLDYTAIGDTVNLASRIEGQTKGIARILVSESTRLACGEQFEFIDHGEHQVKGREQPVRLFEPKRKTT